MSFFCFSSPARKNTHNSRVDEAATAVNGQLEGRRFRAHLRELASKGVDELNAFAAVEPAVFFC